MSGVTQLFRPPIEQPVIGKFGMMSDAWQGWHITNYQALINILQTNFIQLPLITSAQLAGIPAPNNGLVAFNTTTSEPVIAIGGTFRNILHT